MNGAGTQLANFFRYVLGRFGKAVAHAGGQQDHFQAFSADPDFIQQLLDLPHPSGRPEVAGFKMTVPFQTAGHIHAVSALFKGLDDMDGVSTLPEQGTRIILTLAG